MDVLNLLLNCTLNNPVSYQGDGKLSLTVVFDFVFKKTKPLPRILYTVVTMT